MFRVDALSFADWTAAWAEPVGDPGRACVFQSPAYLAVWLDTMGRERRTEAWFLKVDTADGRRVMLLALGIERRDGLRILSFLDGGVVDYAGPVRLGPAAAEVDARAARALWTAVCAALPPVDLVDLDKTPAELDEGPNPLRWLAAETAPSGWTLPLDRDFAWFQQHQNPFTVDSRRKRRRLQDLGPLSFEIARDPAAARRFLQAMIVQKTRRYLETAGWNCFDWPGYRAYFPAITERLGAQVHLSALKVGEQIVATHWGLISGDALLYLMPTYEGGPISRLSPGRILLEELVAWGYANGIRSLDFGHGDEDYKPRFGGRRRVLLRLHAPASWAGRAHLAGQAVDAAVARVKRTPPVSALQRLVWAWRGRRLARADA